MYKKVCTSLPKVIAINVEPSGTASDDDASAVAALSPTLDPLPVVGVACCLGALALAVVVDDLQRKEGFFWVHLFIPP